MAYLAVINAGSMLNFAPLLAILLPRKGVRVIYTNVYTECTGNMFNHRC